MKADKLTVERVFDRTERLEAPLFQRPYVWGEDDNWLPLWESTQAIANKRCEGISCRPHFLGAIVLDQLKTPTGKVHARQIIDGQQRLTTLQLALAAARDLSQALKQEKYAQAFSKMVVNDVPLSDDAEDKFKVWPTNADRRDFVEVMTAGSLEAVQKLPHAEPEDEWLIPEAYCYFYETFAEWLGAVEGAELTRRLDTLYRTLKEDLLVVVIDLEENDDAQLIFETLNALGTPLLPADLVKNYLFHLAGSESEDAEQLYNRFWRNFDDEKAYWRQEVRQGRLKRARLDLFLNHYLMLMTGQEVNAANLFSTFRDFVQETNGKRCSKHMELFRSYADVYRSFEEFPGDSREGVFFDHLRDMDTTTVFPLLLEVFRRHRLGSSRDDVLNILCDLESFLVRRMVCELTTKNYNKFFADVAKQLRDRNDFSPGAVRQVLIAPTSEVSRWPDDREFRTSWLALDFYKRLSKAKLRMILGAVDGGMRTGKSEQVTYGSLTIEHLLPVNWGKHWPLVVKSNTPEETGNAESLRNQMIHKMGNLTLLTKKLNPSVSNGPWSKKLPAILKHSALALNRALQDLATWNEIEINSRSEELFKQAVKLWPHPVGV